MNYKTLIWIVVLSVFILTLLFFGLINSLFKKYGVGNELKESL